MAIENVTPIEAISRLRPYDAPRPRHRAVPPMSNRRSPDDEHAETWVLPDDEFAARRKPVREAEPQTETAQLRTLTVHEIEKILAAEKPKK